MHVPDSDSEDELPPGWEERVTVDGSVFYANHTQRATQWTHPRTGKKKVVQGDLPFGWERCVDRNSGKVIYVDHENKRTTYTDPRLAFAVEEKDHVHDYRQRFDASSTALQVLHGVDLNGKVCLITGANAGIGFETARSMARHGCHVILACRDMASAREAIDKIVTEKPQMKDHLSAIHVDLASLRSVRDMCEEIRRTHAHLDMLILNAGVFGLPYTRTVDGYETTMQVNHLSHFYMTLLLRDRLRVGSRVVVVSSESHRFSYLTADKITAARLATGHDADAKYWDMTAYNDSKLCNVLFVRRLAQKLQTHGISVFSLHPGNMVSSRIARGWWLYRILFAIVRPFTKSLQQAASTSVFCATARELIGVTGVYFNNCFRCEESATGADDAAANRLWAASVDLIQRIMGPERHADSITTAFSDGNSGGKVGDSANWNCDVPIDWEL